MKKWAKTLFKINHTIRTANMDWLNVCCGKERRGKSTLGWESCSLIDPDFTADNVAFNAVQLRGLLSTLPKGSSLMIDEGQFVLYGREALSAEVRWLNKTLMKIGGMNYFIWLNIPDFFALDVYIRKFRVASITKVKLRVTSKMTELNTAHFTPRMLRLMKDIITEKEGKLYSQMPEVKRGIFEVFDQSKLNKIYKVKETSEEKWCAPTFRDSFEAIDPNDPEWIKYLERKEEFMKVMDDGKAKPKEDDDDE